MRQFCQVILCCVCVPKSVILYPKSVILRLSGCVLFTPLCVGVCMEILYVGDF